MNKDHADKPTDRIKIFRYYLPILSIFFLALPNKLMADEPSTQSNYHLRADKEFLSPLLRRILPQLPLELIVLYNEDRITTKRPRPENFASKKQYKENVISWKKSNFPALKNKVIADLDKKLMDVRPIKNFAMLPMNTVRITNRKSLLAFIHHPNIASVYEDTPLHANTDKSLPLIQQPKAISSTYRGTGTTVTVLDSGADYTHNDFGGCSSPGVPASCKIVVSLDLAPDDGSLDDSDHGTHVSAIIAQTAPGVQLAILDVFNGSSSSSSTVIDGINWSITNQATYNIVAINMSLGDGLKYTSPCNNWRFNPFYTPIQDARDADILPIAASGNEAYTDGISRPACTPGAISVGATYDANVGGINYGVCSDSSSSADKVVCFSNSASYLDLLAPGSLISAAGVTMAGTSQASPHVAAAVAILREAYSGDSLDGTLARLSSNGTLVTDQRNNIVTPRINIYRALGAVNDTFIKAIAINSTSGQISIDNSQASKEINEPDHSGNSGGHSIWWNWEAPDNGQLILDTSNSDIDTLLSVYSGTTLDTLTLLAENDDNAQLSDGTSLLLLQVTAGETYNIAVDGKNGAVGNVYLNWTLKPNAQADLSVTALPSLTTPTLGKTLTLTINASNLGPDDATNILASVNFSLGFLIINQPSECQPIASNVIACQLPLLTSGASKDFNIEIQTTELGTMTINASIDSDLPDNNTANNFNSSNIYIVSTTTQVPMLPLWAMLLLFIGLSATVRSALQNSEH
ncbi:MAG: S8 family serine peptidase [Pseudomonadales bacterium]|nr:S8 family serine peptidase [Pseudomonadales bacterium]